MNRYWIPFAAGMRQGLDIVLVIAVCGLLILKLLEFAERRSATDDDAFPPIAHDQHV